MYQASSINPRACKGKREVGCHPPLRFSQIIEKTIYSKKLKLLQGINLSSAEILNCQLCTLHFFFYFVMATANLM